MGRKCVDGGRRPYETAASTALRSVGSRCVEYEGCIRRSSGTRGEVAVPGNGLQNAASKAGGLVGARNMAWKTADLALLGGCVRCSTYIRAKSTYFGTYCIVSPTKMPHIEGKECPRNMPSPSVLDPFSLHIYYLDRYRQYYRYRLYPLFGYVEYSQFRASVEVDSLPCIYCIVPRPLGCIS